MTTTGGVTVAEVIEAVRRRKALLAPETAGYLVLAAADQLAGAPTLLDEHACGVLVDGGRVVLKPSAPSNQADAERGLRRLLHRLLDASNGSAPALSTVAGLPAKGNVTILISELESALIPVNRGAASRALSRLARETLRSRQAATDPRRASAPAPAAVEPIAGAPVHAVDSDMVLELEALSEEDMALSPMPAESDAIEAVEPATADDTEPMPVGRLIEEGPDSPAVPAPPESAKFTDEAVTARREVAISEPPPTPIVVVPSPDPPTEERASALDIDQLLGQSAPSAPPPPVILDLAPAPLPAPTPPPPIVLPSPPPPTVVVAPLPAPTPPPPVVHAPPPLRTPPPLVVLAPPPPEMFAPAPVLDVPAADQLSEPPAVLEELARSSTPAPVQVALPAEPPAPRTYSSQAPSARGVDELLEDFMSSSTRKSDRVAQDLRHMTGVEVSTARRYPSSGPAPQSGPPDAAFQSVSGNADFYTSTPPPRSAGRSMPSLPDEDPLARRSTRRKVYILFSLLALMTIGTVTLLRLKPGVLTGRTPEVVEAERQEAAAAAASIAARKAAGPCRATLVVSDVPQGAEVLVRSGVSPIDVDRLPSGARLEFVALSDGYAPRRGVVPQGAAWDSVNGKPRFELPIQLEKSHAKSGTLDPWPPADPGSVVGGQGPPGTVHLVTSPKGAEVWMVAGGAPEAKLEALACGAGMELLVAGTSQGQPFRRRLRVDASQLTPEPSANAVTGKISAGK
jgi:hypothetical protein